MKDKTPLKIIAVIVIPIVLAVVLRLMEVGKHEKEEKSDKKSSINKSLPGEKAEISILTKWELPEELVEVSGIDWVDSTTVAAVQDEKGILYLYNMVNSQVDRTIPFGPDGDYEGVAVVANTIYVLRADGVIFEIQNFRLAKPLVKRYQTPLKKKEDSESLAYDAKNKRLLVAVKAEDKRGGDEYKGVYVFDLNTKKLDDTRPAFKIPLKSELLKSGKKPKNAISPSDIAIHPVTGELYILEGTRPKLAVMGTDGTIKRVVELDKSDFPQPEGLAFNANGRMYISNEGGKGNGNILDVELSVKDN